MNEIERRFGIMDGNKGCDNKQIIMPMIDITDKTPANFYVEPVTKPTKAIH